MVLVIILSFLRVFITQGCSNHLWLLSTWNVASLNGEML